ncbi:hypothetical protein F5B20DRAFT_567208 [Whalleya microplaca]|nr:hypothetical protein F5B20DRAFT_567208 [Whalleya microplaca]
MAHRTLDDDLAYGERWDRDRFVIESDRNRKGDERDRFEEHDRYYSRGPRDHVRETSVDEIIERERERERKPKPRPWEDDYPRDKRFPDDLPRFRRTPPPELERRLVIDREREYRDSSPAPRPGLLRRQSSLDTFDRRPPPRFVEREEYSPPRRRGEYRPEPYKPIPLPRSRALPPPRIYAERDWDEIKISEPDRYGDDDYHAYPDRIREREIIRSRRRRDGSESGTSRSHTHRGSSVRSSSRGSTKRSRSSSSSNDSGGTAVTAKSQYPKKGKTRIPRRLISIRALMELQYPYTEEGKTIVVQKALGQQNIDDLLKMSEDYNKSEIEVAAARSVPGGVVEEREREVFTIPPPPSAPPAPEPPAPPAIIHTPAPAPAPVAQAQPMELVRESYYRETSPARAPSIRSHSTSTSARTPLIVNASPREYSDEVALGPLAIVGDRRRGDREIKMEIARLEAERDLIRSDRHHHHHHHHRSHSHSHSHSHSRHRSHSHSTEREVVRAERLPTGELVVYEEQVEKIEEPRRGVRIEKDKKGPPPNLMRAMLATLT